jgi:glycosyltransferase involved in cell wall biosynthesis
VPLRILQVDTERGWRGGQRQTLLIARELMRLGHACTIVARAGEPLAARARAQGIAVIDVQPHSELALATALRLRGVIRRERIQIVHAEAAHAHTLAALATLGTTAKLVVTRHTARPPRANAGTRWKYGRAAAVIAVSRAAADLLGSAGVAAQSVNVIPGGVELDRDVAPASAELLATLGVRAGAPLVVWVGALTTEKDPETFVRAAAVAATRVPGMQGLLVGEGARRGNVSRIIHELRMRDTIHLAGFRTDVDKLIAAARVLASSSVIEGLPLVIMDAFALGVPVAATAGTGVPELVTDGVTGLLVPVDDANALGNAIARLLEDPTLAASIRDRARARARDYSIERTARATVAVYERVLSAAG